MPSRARVTERRCRTEDEPMTDYPIPWRLSRRHCALLFASLAAVGLPASASAQELHALARVLVHIKPPEKPPQFSFATAAGAHRTLADYRGKGVLLNIWATWCGPCVAEMPALDQLATKIAADEIVVLPVSIDTKGLPAVKEFYATHHIEHLPILLDPDGAVARVLKLPGIPASLIIDREGRVVGHVLGAIAWDKPEAIAVIRKLIGAKG